MSHLSKEGRTRFTSLCRRHTHACRLDAAPLSGGAGQAARMDRTQERSAEAPESD